MITYQSSGASVVAMIRIEVKKQQSFCCFKEDALSFHNESTVLNIKIIGQ